MKQGYAVFFDLDGTLIDLNPEPAEQEQLRKAIVEHTSSVGVSVVNKGIFTMYQRVVTEHGFAHPISKRMRLDLDAYETRWAQHRSTVKHGVRHLGELRRRGHLFAIVTNNGKSCLEALFHTNKLESGWFDLVVTRDDTSLLKPSHLPLGLAWHLAQQRSPGLSRVWFVGDREEDHQAARAFNHCVGAGLSFVLIGPSSCRTVRMGQILSYPCLDEFFKKEVEL